MQVFSNLLSTFKNFELRLKRPTSAMPLSVFRLLFGLLMVFSSLRFMVLGWIEDHYIHPKFHFKYWGFEWVKPLSVEGLYAIHIIMIIGALGVAFASKIIYRISSITLFITFTYTELIDITYYLNHYYYVSIVCLLLCVIPTPPPVLKKGYIVPLWVIAVFKLQIAIVYIYAGLAKINYDWLILALPLKIWLPAHDKMPLIGEIFTWKITPYLFAWLGMLYDCLIVFFLLNKRTRLLAYGVVVIFHTLVGLLFQIGVFPLVMMAGTLIFFNFEEQKDLSQQPVNFSYKKMPVFLYVFFVFQMLFPWRYLLYKGNLFWTEEGYRYSWRVMLMEKAGTATFYIKDSKTGREGIVDNREFLNPHQEKQMAMQPDMILQFAHFLAEYYSQKGVYKPKVRVEAYVTLNGRPSKLLIDPQIDLTQQKDTFSPKKWILHYEND